MWQFVLRLKLQNNIRFLAMAAGLIILLVVAIILYALLQYTKQVTVLKEHEKEISKQLFDQGKQLKDLKSQDQYVINQDLKKHITDLEDTYQKSVTSYEQIVELRDKKVDTAKLDSALAKVIHALSQKNYASASALLTVLNKDIDEQKKKVVSSFTIPKNILVSNNAPSSGYSRQQVQSDVGTFMVDVIASDLNTTRVIVDTASDGDCHDNCPVMALGDYVARSGAFAGINGAYFCPATYPSCAGKTNSFDTLLMNKNKTYFNSDNNVYSTVPAVIFSGNSARFVTQSLQWGRDTSVDAVIANQPLLVLNGDIQFGGDADPKHGSRGSRSFVGASGNIAYIGVIYNATVVEAAHVLKTMGIQNALNLDSGGSTALWVGGYKAGPGRGIPNAILFVRK
jgi:hypothetical protein